MISIFVALALGFVFSKLIPWPGKAQESIGKLSTLAIILLLFFMGVTIGANKNVMTNLPSLGLQALLMASATVVGSTVAVWIVVRLFKRGSSKDEVKTYD